MKKALAIATLATMVSLASLGAFADSSTFEGATKDAWLTGKLETAFVLNGHLNPFAIETDVDGGVVHLTGVVKDDIDRDLAEEIAKGIDGVIEVKNDLEVDEAGAEAAAKERAAGNRDFGSWVDDATTTAAIKSKLLGSANTKGLKIDVDTADDVVTLSGRVGSAEESRLAEEIAENTGDVKTVRNNLVVDPL
jgi:osmotically-inducible protein OsmY